MSKPKPIFENFDQLCRTLLFQRKELTRIIENEKQFLLDSTGNEVRTNQIKETMKRGKDELHKVNNLLKAFGIK